jgi:hypothetical protein
MHIFLIAYLGGKIVAIQPMASMDQCRELANEASRKLNEMMVDQLNRCRRSRTPSLLSLGRSTRKDGGHAFRVDVEGQER